MKKKDNNIKSTTSVFSVASYNPFKQTILFAIGWAFCPLFMILSWLIKREIVLGESNLDGSNFKLITFKKVKKWK